MVRWVMNGTAIPMSLERSLHFSGHRLSFARLFDDAHGAMQTLLWHKDQKVVSALILAVCTEAQTQRQICPHRPLLAKWT